MVVEQAYAYARGSDSGLVLPQVDTKLSFIHIQGCKHLSKVMYPH